LCHFVDGVLTEIQQLFSEQSIVHVSAISVTSNIAKIACSTLLAAVFAQCEAPAANAHYCWFAA